MSADLDEDTHNPTNKFNTNKILTAATAMRIEDKYETLSMRFQSDMIKYNNLWECARGKLISNQGQ